MRKGGMYRQISGILTASLVIACAQTASVSRKKTASEVNSSENPALAQTRKSLPERKFEPPGDLDRMLDANPLGLKATNQAARVTRDKASVPGDEAANPGKGRFHIQISAETDFDAAQEKKKEYEKKLGSEVDVVFDAPYYKLRWGSFETRQAAEDRLLDISDLKVQGFVIKQ
jgi:hypothetical protein